MSEELDTESATMGGKGNRNPQHKKTVRGRSQRMYQNVTFNSTSESTHCGHSSIDGRIGLQSIGLVS